MEEYRYVCEWDPEPDPRISIGATYSPIFKYIGSQLPTFEDNFSTAKGEWGSTSAGYWIPGMIQEETLVVMSPRTDTAFPINGLFKATDFALSFDFHPYGEDIGGVIGLVFRASERLGTYYQFKISFPMGRIKPYRAAWLFSTSDATIVRTTEQGLVSLPIDLTRLSLSSMERMRGSL
jgi:hypothetical protein